MGSINIHLEGAIQYLNIFSKLPKIRKMIAQACITTAVLLSLFIPSCYSSEQPLSKDQLCQSIAEDGRAAPIILALCNLSQEKINSAELPSLGAPHEKRSYYGGKRGLRIPLYSKSHGTIPGPSLRGSRSYLSSGWNRIPIRKRPSKMMTWGMHRLPVDPNGKRSEEMDSYMIE